ncbi:MAG: hypothetical protein R3C58_04120 [Parvularculaceae bacterium]
MTATTRIAMLSGPRNISTTMMRSFGARADTLGEDETCYACYHVASGADHPMRAETLTAQKHDWAEIARDLNALSATPYKFEKHIAFHFRLAPDFDCLKNARVFHLIRDPAAMVASYKNKLDDVAPIIDSYRIQRRLYEEAPAPVVDAADILKAPEAMLRKLCAALDMPFTPAMLSWEKGPKPGDGVWGPHWYDALWASTGFKPFEEKTIMLPPALQDVADACADDYAFFHSRRLTV